MDTRAHVCGHGYVHRDVRTLLVSHTYGCTVLSPSKVSLRRVLGQNMWEKGKSVSDSRCVFA